jgi:hypothetical protein
MDDGSQSISPDLPYVRLPYARLGSKAAPIIVDVRRDADFVSAGTRVADVVHRSPDWPSVRAYDGIRS